MIRCRKTTDRGQLPADVRLRADQHPLGVACSILYAIGSTAIAVGTGLVAVGILLPSSSALTAGVLVNLGALVMGHHSRSMRERAISAACDQCDYVPPEVRAALASSPPYHDSVSTSAAQELEELPHVVAAVTKLKRK
ncbi:Uncharacterised protein [Mycobacteroides abscessus subsp. abscessus]|nr:Uncharacterised protein [Mycobacteroides abscessus subsp. abscessus]